MKPLPMSCRLCRQNAPLRNSHIAPEFLYKPVYDNLHRIFERRVGALTKAPPRQKGYRERLLCDNCEQRFSKWERYARDVIFGATPLVLERAGDNAVIRDLDYSQVRLFLLSMLWRMSVASGEMWSEVRVSQTDEIAIQEMLLCEEAPDEADYPAICIFPFFDGRFYPDFILQADCVQNKHGPTIRVIFAGILFTFLVGCELHADELAPYFPKRDGSWTLPVVSYTDLPFLKHDVETMKPAIVAEGKQPRRHERR